MAWVCRNMWQAAVQTSYAARPLKCDSIILEGHCAAIQRREEASKRGKAALGRGGQFGATGASSNLGFPLGPAISAGPRQLYVRSLALLDCGCEPAAVFDFGLLCHSLLSQMSRLLRGCLC